MANIKTNDNDVHEVDILTTLEEDQSLLELMTSDLKKSILMQLKVGYSPNGVEIMSSNEYKNNLKFNFLRVLKAFRSSKSIIMIDFYHSIFTNKYNYSKHLKYFLYLQNSKLLTTVNLYLSKHLDKKQKKYLWKGLSYCKYLEELEIDFVLSALDFDLCERKTKVKNLTLGSIEWIDIFLLKRQNKELKKYVGILNLPLLYDKNFIKYYISFFFNNSLKHIIDLKDTLLKDILKSMFQYLPEFSMNLIE